VKPMNTMRTFEEIDRTAADCRKAVRKYAFGSGIGSAVPVLGADMAADALLATSMLNEILRRFQLRQADIDMLDLETKAVLVQAAKAHGCRLVGKTVTRSLLIRITAGSARSATARRLGKYVPVFGQAIAAGIGYGAMAALGSMVITECVRVRKSLVLRDSTKR